MAIDKVLLDLLAAAYKGRCPAFAAQLARARVISRKVWADGSLHLDLDTLGQVGLTAKQRSELTGTHPGLPFELRIRGRTEGLAGVVWFEQTGTTPHRVEVNAFSEDGFNPDQLGGERLEVVPAEPGQAFLQAIRGEE
jgi:hypothetical protein